MIRLSKPAVGERVWVRVAPSPLKRQATRLEIDMSKFDAPERGYGVLRWSPDDPVVLTADRQPITQGLRVFTNNLDRGVIDLSRAEYQWHPGESRWVLWFDVAIDTSYKGEPASGRDMQSDDRVATRFQGRSA